MRESRLSGIRCLDNSKTDSPESVTGADPQNKDLLSQKALHFQIVAPNAIGKITHRCYSSISIYDV